MNKETTVIEINGVKLEVDLRHAKRIDTLRIGDRVKLLEKQYSNNVTVHPGVIAGFEPFPSAPTIIVAYIERSYKAAELKFAYLRTNDTECKFEIVPSIDGDLALNPGDIVSEMNAQILSKEQEIADLAMRRDYFLANFQKYFPETHHVPS